MIFWSDNRSSSCCTPYFVTTWHFSLSWKNGVLNFKFFSLLDHILPKQLVCIVRSYGLQAQNYYYMHNGKHMNALTCNVHSYICSIFNNTKATAEQSHDMLHFREILLKKNKYCCSNKKKQVTNNDASQQNFTKTHEPERKGIKASNKMSSAKINLVQQNWSNI